MGFSQPGQSFALMRPGIWRRSPSGSRRQPRWNWQTTIHSRVSRFLSPATAAGHTARSRAAALSISHREPDTRRNLLNLRRPPGRVIRADRFWMQAAAWQGCCLGRGKAARWAVAPVASVRFWRVLGLTGLRHQPCQVVSRLLLRQRRKRPRHSSSQ